MTIRQRYLEQEYRDFHIKHFGTGDHTLTRPMTALHEAGHAVIYRFLGQPVGIQLNQDSEGYWTGYCGALKRSEIVYSDNLEAQISADICICMSGYLSEKLFSDCYCPSSSGGDKAKAYAGASILAELIDSSKELILDEIETATAQLLRPYKQNCLRLTNVMQHSLTISPKQLKKIIKVDKRFPSTSSLGNFLLSNHITSA